MEKYSRDILAFLILSIVFYLAFSIFNGTFNLFEWGNGSRFVYAAGMIISVLNIEYGKD